MSPKTNPVQGRPEPGADSPDFKTIQAVKEILQLLSKTISAHKLFPDSHDSIVRFRENLLALLQGFFEEHDEIEIEIESSEFFYEGTAVFKDENILRSLPYLFFKDGMKTLAFIKGITSEELAEFLALLKTTSLLPLEVSDIVDALWQKEFEHIRFYAPDDYLEAQVSVAERIPIQFHVYKNELYHGRIELRPEDVMTMFEALRKSTAPGPKPEEDESEAMNAFSGFDESEQRQLEALLHAERRVSEEQEFIDLTFELLNVEERQDVFDGILKFLEERHAAALHSLDFERVVPLMRKADQLAQKLEGVSLERARAVEQFRSGLLERAPREEILRASSERHIPSPRYLMEYLTLMGPGALSLAVEAYEASRDAEFRTLARDYFEEMGRKDPAKLAEQARADRTYITKAVIDVFSHMRDPRTIPALASFSAYQDKSVRLRSIQALGGFSEEGARKALRALLQDGSEEIRIEAAGHIRLGEDPDSIRDWIRIVSDKTFARKSQAEKSVFLLTLGKSQSEAATGFLRGLLLKSSLFGRARFREIRLGAARALEAQAGPAAIEALEAGARAGDRKVRTACRQAMGRLRTGGANSRKKGS